MKYFIYKIIDKTNNNIYIGSTTRKLLNRLSSHKNQFKQFLIRKHNYISSFEILKNNNYCIEEIESFNFISKKEMLEKEKEFIHNNNCINIVKNPYRTKEEKKNYHQKWRDENKILIKESNIKWCKKNKSKKKNNDKEYYQKNSTKIKEQVKKYRKENQEKIKERLKKTFICNCGAELLLCNKLRHLKSQKHLTHETVQI